MHVSELGEQLFNFTVLSQNPAQLHKWRCGMNSCSILSNLGLCILIFSVCICPKMGMVDQKWASGHGMEIFTLVIFTCSSNSIKDSLLINLETMLWAPDMADNNILINFIQCHI